MVRDITNNSVYLTAVANSVAAYAQLLKQKHRLFALVGAIVFVQIIRYPNHHLYAGLLLILIFTNQMPLIKKSLKF
jgi:hypothetical protein